jgi:hypothetical protein
VRGTARPGLNKFARAVETDNEEHNQMHQHGDPDAWRSRL